MTLVTVSIAHEYIADGWPTFAAVARRLRPFGPDARLLYIGHVETYDTVSSYFMVDWPVFQLKGHTAEPDCPCAFCARARESGLH